MMVSPPPPILSPNRARLIGWFGKLVDFIETRPYLQLKILRESERRGENTFEGGWRKIENGKGKGKES